MEISDISLNSARCLVGSQRGLLPKICLPVSEGVWLVTATVRAHLPSGMSELGLGQTGHREVNLDFPLIAQ